VVAWMTAERRSVVTIDIERRMIAVQAGTVRDRGGGGSKRAGARS
jgi:hypothetical protein